MAFSQAGHRTDSRQCKKRDVVAGREYTPETGRQRSINHAFRPAYLCTYRAPDTGGGSLPQLAE
jgi:hypothetical protein